MTDNTTTTPPGGDHRPSILEHLHIHHFHFPIIIRRQVDAIEYLDGLGSVGDGGTGDVGGGVSDLGALRGAWLVLDLECVACMGGHQQYDISCDEYPVHQFS